MNCKLEEYERGCTFGPLGEGGILPGLSGCTTRDCLLLGGSVGGGGGGPGSRGVEDVAGGEGGLDALERLGGDGLRVPLEELLRLLQLLVLVGRHRLLLLQVEREREITGPRRKRG